LLNGSPPPFIKGGGLSYLEYWSNGVKRNSEVGMRKPELQSPRQSAKSMEWRDIGVMEWLSDGVLEYWGDGVLE